MRPIYDLACHVNGTKWAISMIASMHFRKRYEVDSILDRERGVNSNDATSWLVVLSHAVVARHQCFRFATDPRFARCTARSP